MKIPQKSTKKPRLTPKQKLFLETFIKKMGHITETCEEVKIDRKTYYNWIEQELFKNKLNESMEHFNDSGGNQARIAEKMEKTRQAVGLFLCECKGKTERIE